MSSIEARDVTKEFVPRSQRLSLLAEKHVTRAVDHISISLRRKVCLGLAGESGSGKTTLGELLAGIQSPTSGEIFFLGKNIARLSKDEFKLLRRKVQVIPQDPFESIDPHYTVMETLTEPLEVNDFPKEDHYQKARRALELAELKPADAFLGKYPNELSGGQRQRVAISRALVVDPEFLIADEPVSMLDASIRASILNLLRNLKNELGLGLLYVSHDLSTVRYVSDMAAIMYRGWIIEIGPASEVLKNPFHPYTKALIASVPILDPDRKRTRATIKDSTAAAAHQMRNACRYMPRCPYAQKECNAEPLLRQVALRHSAACHFAEAIQKSSATVKVEAVGR
jgi:peptide/nickel transport system ATP-binding protein